MTRLQKPCDNKLIMLKSHGGKNESYVKINESPVNITFENK